MFMERNCEICFLRKKEKIYHKKFIIPTKNFFHSGYDVVICRECNFAYADKIPTQDFFESYYKEMSKKTFYLKKSIYKKVNNSYYEKEMDKRLRYSFSNFKKYINKSMKILDLGCYTGELMHILKINGFKNLIGVDPSRYAGKMAKQKYGVKVIKASIFEDLSSIGKFDFIIINHVLEHIKDLNSFLSIVFSLLKTNGMIYIETPDANNFFISKSDKYLPEHQDPFQQFSVEHINFFTKVSLFNLLNRNGFKKVKLQSKVSVIAILSSVWKKNRLLKDNKIKNNLKKYLKESNKLISSVQLKIKKIRNTENKIFVWGSGLHTQKLLGMTDLIKCDIYAFIDSDENYYDARLVNKPIISPKIIYKKPKYPILISSQAYQDDILDQINKLGLKNRIITLYNNS